jgi:hypothetical protein
MACGRRREHMDGKRALLTFAGHSGKDQPAMGEKWGYRKPGGFRRTFYTWMTVASGKLSLARPMANGFR